mmetsp:Transcript_71776/g.126723  ORF Transcript_71776/g.126723 Transcript_71776/m.126723 type:complete len:109 (-) Transcript_71776:355-681(-)|eukprot:CAMPEP_0197639304 /NCGR_PEP_ID=MMETSP1338-20131121/13961_1 /TAXON_ID=43686 ORGANISM="Pelagodinium beii, Strain RCC1491" /NCGR_SAMPLE_ID=MMETSP1338 /ASSEMBLY_ACC=CAM_ASM_000754 /LENGTH=108 /DNA_ID=CAMNT_0043212009 /DNA_START=97 /DNA_END=423 /DNA_ORIENTATION=-
MGCSGSSGADVSQDGIIKLEKTPTILESNRKLREASSPIKLDQGSSQGSKIKPGQALGSRHDARGVRNPSHMKPQQSQSRPPPSESVRLKRANGELYKPSFQVPFEGA